MSRCSPEEVSTTMGINRQAALALTSCRTWSPSTFGNFRSSNTSLGGLAGDLALKIPRQNRKSRASSPSRATSILLLRLLLSRARSVSCKSFGSYWTSRLSFASSVIASSRKRLWGLDFQAPSDLEEERGPLHD